MAITLKRKRYMKSSKQTKQWFDQYFRYVNYLAAGMLYLKDNFLLREPLRPEHIKDRILGHWGTVPGINFIYMHLNYLISRRKPNILLVTGPGHGAPANLANLFVENTLHEFYVNYSRNEKGIANLLHNFSWPGGFPSHLYPGVPGGILEGGELGYSLSTAYGAAFDNPDLIVACIVGDGEAETGPLAAAWHSNKFLNPATSGAVLPILHVNGYKISNPTIYGTMSDRELTQLFTGYGYDVQIFSVIGKPLMAIHQKMIDLLDAAYKKIHRIQSEAREKPPTARNLKNAGYKPPRWPMIILRTPKGWTGVKEIFGKTHKPMPVEGSYRSHGIPLSDPKTNSRTFALLEAWLKNYRIQELVDEKGRPKDELFTHIPSGKFRMGMNVHAYGGNLRKNLELPSISRYEVKFLSPCSYDSAGFHESSNEPRKREVKKRDESRASTQAEVGNTEVAAAYLRDIFIRNKSNFRLFCPDETESNKLQKIFEVTPKAYMWPLKPEDDRLAPDGRVMEILSEHTLQGWLQGYLLTGRHGIFATYEAFAMINGSMVDQYAKFLKQSKRISWRKPISSLNYLLTSLGWRQEHNGYSHQNPSFISNVLEKHGEFCSVYFPVDANSFLVVLEDCLKRKNSINVIVAGKQSMPQWLTLEEAKKQILTGVGRWDWIQQEHAQDPDAVLVSAGDHMTLEAMAAIDILKKLLPELKLRYVNVMELTALGIGDERHPFRLDSARFEHYFTKDRPIVFNFHGYPDVLKKLLWNHPVSRRISIHGYLEEGTTTTPYNMHVLNKTSRWHLCMDLIEQAAGRNKKVNAKKKKLLTLFKKKLIEHEQYILENGRDLPEIENWKWGK